MINFTCKPKSTLQTPWCPTRRVSVHEGFWLSSVGCVRGFATQSGAGARGGTSPGDGLSETWAAPNTPGQTGVSVCSEPSSPLLRDIVLRLLPVSWTGSLLKRNLPGKTSPGLNQTFHLLLKIMSVNGRIHKFSQGKEKMIPLTYITAITIKR